jgi:hypothetical protein
MIRNMSRDHACAAAHIAPPAASRSIRQSRRQFRSKKADLGPYQGGTSGNVLMSEPRQQLGGSIRVHRDWKAPRRLRREIKASSIEARSTKVVTLQEVGLYTCV